MCDVLRTVIAVLLAFAVVEAQTAGSSVSRRVNTQVSDEIVQEFLSKERMPACLGRCVERLVASLHTHLADVHFDQLCHEYEVARECVALRGDQCAVQRRYFEIFTSGLDYACLDQRRSFDSFMPCVARFANDSTNGCSEPCNLYGTFIDVIEGDPLRQLLRSSHSLLVGLQHLGPLCTSLKCYLKCTREEVNMHCENSGVKLVEVMLRPLELLGKALSDDERALLTVENFAPLQCQDLLKSGTIDEIRFESAFRYELDRMVNKKKNEILLNRTVAEEIDEEAEEELELDDGVDVELKPPHWKEQEKPVLDVGQVLALIVCLLLLIINLVALFLTVVWCCKQQDETTYGKDNTSSGPSGFTRFFLCSSNA